ncbi:MAG: flavodoxin domain-containing protein [Bacteroidota bacterium]
MRAAIIYISNHGTTEKIAHILQSEIGKDNSQLFNLKENIHFDLSEFDVVFIGGSIHAGLIQKKITAFCQNRIKSLLQKKVGLFLCGMYEGKEAEKQISNAFPQNLQNHAKSYQYVGGELLFEKMNFFEKMIVKKVVGVTVSESKIKHESIKKLLLEMQ